MKVRQLAVFAAALLLVSAVSSAYEAPKPVATERGDEPGTVKRFAATIVSGDSEPGPVPLPPVKPVPVLIKPGGGLIGPSTLAVGGVPLGGSAGASSFDRVLAAEHRMRRTIRLLD